MSELLNRQEITLTVSYDPEEYDNPSDWNWEELVGSYCRVIKSSPVEEIFGKVEQ